MLADFVILLGMFVGILLPLCLLFWLGDAIARWWLRATGRE